uniref:Uncharacterized protein n=1 Tax=uncultured Rhodospirillales bacterium HF0200_01O14 TaxID=710787 RepID=E0XTS6_9PROT|nr:hypothetical protein [uncultured Rhodospirillales bacterium HF0200_01O14]
MARTTLRYLTFSSKPMFFIRPNDQYVEHFQFGVVRHADTQKSLA